MNSSELLLFAAFSIPVCAVVGLVAGSLFFLALKKQLRTLAAQHVETSESLEQLRRVVSVLETHNLEAFHNRITELENRKPITVPEPSAPAFVGTSRRGQVLRLHRNGEAAVNIAETLGVSQGEVDLTLKLQNLFSQTVP